MNADVIKNLRDAFSKVSAGNDVRVCKPSVQREELLSPIPVTKRRWLNFSFSHIQASRWLNAFTAYL